jgi:hypothetical protein
VATVSYSGEPAVVDIAEMQQRLMANQTATLITKEVIVSLIFLIFIIWSLTILLFCRPSTGLTPARFSGSWCFSPLPSW